MEARMEASTFGPRLKELREAKGLTQKQLAEMTGLSTGGVAHLEQGLHEPTWPVVCAMAEALGVDCTAFTVPPATTAKAKRGRRPKQPPAAPATARKRSPRKKGKSK
jgi:transcriptional regulator with XRE-family HTH domain